MRVALYRGFAPLSRHARASTRSKTTTSHSCETVDFPAICTPTCASRTGLFGKVITACVYSWAFDEMTPGDVRKTGEVAGFRFTSWRDTWAPSSRAAWITKSQTKASYLSQAATLDRVPNEAFAPRF